MRIGSLHQSEVIDGYIQDAVCPNCGRNIQAPGIRRIIKGYILFIPFIKSTVGYHSICPCCGTDYSFSAREYRSIFVNNNSGLNYYTACEKKLKLKKEKYDKYQNRSDKKIGVAAYLALFGGLIGAQNMYMGYKKRSNIAIAILAIALVLLLIAVISNVLFISTISAMMLAFNVYWGMIDCCRILSGYAKDSSGKYIMSNKQYQKRNNVDDN